MAFQKSSPQLSARFIGALPDHPDVERRQMFGYPACFVNGNFFSGLFEESVVLRLPGDIRGKFPELAQAEGFGPMGRLMKDWYIVPGAISKDEKKLAQLLAGCFVEAQKLPLKERKPKKPPLPASAKRAAPKKG